MRLIFLSLLISVSCSPRYKLVEQQPEQPPPVKEAPRAAIPEPETVPMAELERPPYAALEWRTLQGLNTRTGEITPALRKLEGGAVKLTGYMVPFADEYQSANEFLLVPAAGMCVHTPAPPMNQIVFVQMTGGAAKVTMVKPVTVSGIISIAQSDSPYGKVAFKMEAAEAKEEASY